MTPCINPGTAKLQPKQMARLGSIHGSSFLAAYHPPCHLAQGDPLSTRVPEVCTSKRLFSSTCALCSGCPLPPIVIFTTQMHAWQCHNAIVLSSNPTLLLFLFIELLTLSGQLYCCPMPCQKGQNVPVNMYGHSTYLSCYLYLAIYNHLNHIRFIVLQILIHNKLLIFTLLKFLQSLLLNPKS